MVIWKIKDRCGERSRMDSRACGDKGFRHFSHVKLYTEQGRHHKRTTMTYSVPDVLTTVHLSCTWLEINWIVWLITWYTTCGIFRILLLTVTIFRATLWCYVFVDLNEISSNQLNLNTVKISSDWNWMLFKLFLFIFVRILIYIW